MTDPRMGYCGCSRGHIVNIFLCDHQYLQLKEFAIEMFDRHGCFDDIYRLLWGDDFAFICDNCVKNSCDGIRRKRLERYINRQISYQKFILHTP